jgi:hypothetical protein
MGRNDKPLGYCHAEREARNLLATDVTPKFVHDMPTNHEYDSIFS